MFYYAFMLHLEVQHGAGAFVVFKIEKYSDKSWMNFDFSEGEL